MDRTLWHALESPGGLVTVQVTGSDTVGRVGDDVRREMAIISISIELPGGSDAVGPGSL